MSRLSERLQRRKAWFFSAQRGLCCHGGRPMRVEGNSGTSATFDHMVPVLGKSRTTRMTANVLLAHRRCNNNRNHAPVSEALLNRARKLWGQYMLAPFHGVALQHSRLVAASPELSAMQAAFEPLGLRSAAESAQSAG